ncbi:MAG: hypothetical protein H6807_16120 [Planctomycetes bacterium]|nr:hypothetical protein [Planctomycetota bacterium]
MSSTTEVLRLSHDCPDAAALQLWLSRPAEKREPGVTAHVFCCNRCTAVVMAEVRFLRGDRTKARLGALAATLVLGVGLWKLGLVPGLGGSGGTDPGPTPAGERAAIAPADPGAGNGPTLASTDDYPPPIDAQGNLWVPAGWKPGGVEGSTPYPNEEESPLGARSARVVAWLKRKNNCEDQAWAEDGQEFYLPTFHPGARQPKDMAPQEFLDWAARTWNTTVGHQFQAMERLQGSGNPVMLAAAIHWYAKGDNRVDLTGLRNPALGLAKAYIESFDLETVRKAIDAKSDDGDGNTPARLWTIYQTHFMQ